MAVRSGQIIWDAEGFVISRLQMAGVQNVNIPSEQVSEVGNFKTAGLVRDTPDLSFELQSLDVGVDIEALLCGTNPTAVQSGTGATPTPTTLDFLANLPIDVTSPFRAANATYNIVQGVVIPYLNLEQVQYRYGLKANAEETFTLRGDSIYYIPGIPIQESVTSTAGQTTFNFTYGPALAYSELGFTVYCLNLWWFNATTGLYKRLFHGQDFTDSTTGLTLNAGVAIPTGSTVYLCYGIAAAGTPPTPTAPYYYGPNSTASTSVLPAAIRSKDMDVYIGTNNTMVRLSGVQSFDATWRVNLMMNEEFGNPHYTSMDFNYATVNGTLELKGVDPFDVISKIQQLLGTGALGQGAPTASITGPLTYPPIQLEVRLRNPVTHALLKTIYVPDAEFEPPPINGRTNQELTTQFRFDSPSGEMQVFGGERIGGEAARRRPVQINSPRPDQPAPAPEPAPQPA